MKTTIDLKSTVLGIVLGMSLFALLGAAGASKEGEQPIGRYQVAAGNSLAYVVDTKTGQVWTSFQTTPPDENRRAFYPPKSP